jgi:hypothetical protein
MANASRRALELPGGQEILERMDAGTVSVADGIVCLLVLSGAYERR